MSETALSTELQAPATSQRRAARRLVAQPWVGRLVGLVLTATLISILLGPRGYARLVRIAATGRLHAPRFDLIAAEPLAVKIHLATIAASFVLGGVILYGAKGKRMHRTLGWGWSAFMGTTAVASLFIHQATGGFSILHLFSAITLVALPVALAAARRHAVALHRRVMTNLFFSALIVAGFTAFLPSRLMWRIFFG